MKRTRTISINEDNIKVDVELKIDARYLSRDECNLMAASAISGFMTALSNTKYLYTNISEMAVR